MSTVKHEYKCFLCENNNWDTKTHHKDHLKTNKHKQNLQIFKLSFNNLTDEEKIEKYGSIDLKYIIKNIITMKRNKKNKPIKFIKKKDINQIEWTLDNNEFENNNKR